MSVERLHGIAETIGETRNEQAQYVLEKIRKPSEVINNGSIES